MTAKPKIVILCHSYEPFVSGAEMFVKELVKRLCFKYDFLVITSRFSSKLLKLEAVNGCLVRRVGLGLPFWLDKFWFLLAAPFYVFKEKPAIIHGVMESYGGIALIVVRLFKKKVPTILTLQCGDLDHPKKQRKIPGFLWRKIHTTPDYITAISGALSKRAEFLRRSSKNIFVIANGFDTAGAVLKDFVVPFRIVCVARLSWEKGIEYLIKAMPVLIAEFPQAHLILIGRGPEKEKLEELVRKLGVAEAVNFRGFLEHKEVLNQMAEATVFVCPSLAEGLGNVFLEAQACKTPVIGTNVGGIPDIIQNNFNGLLVPSQDSLAIVEAIKKIFHDPVFAQKLADNGFKTVSRFSWENVIKQMDSLYQTIIT